MRTLAGNRKPVTRLAYLPDGRLASAGPAGEVGVWGPLGEGRVTLAGGGGRVTGLAASPGGEWLAWCGWSMPLAVAPAGGGGSPGGVPLSTDYHPAPQALAFAPDGTLVAVNGRFARWRSPGWEPLDGGLGAPAVSAYDCLAASPDGRSVVAGSRRSPYHLGHTVAVFDVESGAHFPAFGGRDPFPDNQRFTALAYSPDGTFVAGLRGVCLHVWLADTGEVVHTSRPERGRLNALAFSPDGRTLATGGNDGTVTLRDTAHFAVVARYDWRLGKIYDVAFSPDGLTAAAACGKWGRVLVFDVVA